MYLEPVTLQEIDFEHSSFFDSENFKELSSAESFEMSDKESSGEGSGEEAKLQK